VVKARDAASLLEQLSKHGLHVWVAGGWAVDAIVGEQTRLHGDLDLAVDADELTEVIGVLNGLGYRITTNSLPLRVELTTTRSAGSIFTRFAFEQTEAVRRPVSTTRHSSTGRMVSPWAPSTVTACPVSPGDSSSASVMATTGGRWITMMWPCSGRLSAGRTNRTPGDQLDCSRRNGRPLRHDREPRRRRVS